MAMRIVYLTWPNWALAAATTWSLVNPNCCCSTFSGADAPKVFIPRIAPVNPVYFVQPQVEACSTATRAVTEGGSTVSRYSWLCCSNNSQEGMLTTRAPMPSDLSCSNAATQRETSL